jgi:hypothetical protein
VGAAGVTVTVAVPLTPLIVALIVVVPPPAAVTRPPLTVATLAEELLQFAVAVTSPVEPSDQVPVALSCCVAPDARVAVDGEIAMDARAGGAPFPDPWVPEAELPPPHPESAAIAKRTVSAGTKRRREGGRWGTKSCCSRWPRPGFDMRKPRVGFSAGRRRAAKMREGSRVSGAIRGDTRADLRREPKRNSKMDQIGHLACGVRSVPWDAG